eukprot:CAMPEP_0177597668 /NCGR_PEP_ID=MMETSP0419_2-20121207/11851_1 /TAXON_ID=582737 /ORGANISM="Tetraselmis sp., Strain GSL018" /LENGTH=165 /DNA_ID=CAMNT_0019089887 /DNA_START=371 /DNA_END=868 /DNA_ORIENTATION=-
MSLSRSRIQPLHVLTARAEGPAHISFVCRTWDCRREFALGGFRRHCPPPRAEEEAEAEEETPIGPPSALANDPRSLVAGLAPEFPSCARFFCIRLSLFSCFTCFLLAFRAALRCSLVCLPASLPCASPSGVGRAPPPSELPPSDSSDGSLVSGLDVLADSTSRRR